MKQLLLETWNLGKQVLLLESPRELYVLLALNGGAATLVGLLLGSLS